MKVLIRSIVLFTALLVNAVAVADAKESFAKASKPSFNFLLPSLPSTKVAFKFEEHFNYFEAITELKRSNYFQASVGTQLKIAELYALSNNFKKSQIYYSMAKKSSSDEKLQLAIELAMLQSSYKQGQLSFNNLQQFKRRHRLSHKADQSFRLNSIRYLLQNERKKESLILASTLDESKMNLSKLKSFLNTKPKQIHSAALLWSILPGGYFYYSSEYKKAALATATVSLLSVASIFLFQSGALVGAVISGIFAFRFYLNSIQESARHRVYSNVRLRNKYFSKAIEMTGGQIDFSDVYSFKFAIE